MILTCVNKSHFNINPLSLFLFLKDLDSWSSIKEGCSSEIQCSGYGTIIHAHFSAKACTEFNVRLICHSPPKSGYTSPYKTRNGNVSFPIDADSLLSCLLWKCSIYSNPSTHTTRRRIIRHISIFFLFRNCLGIKSQTVEEP